MFVSIATIYHIDALIAKDLLFHVRCKIADSTFHWNRIKEYLIEMKEIKGLLTVENDKVNFYVRLQGTLINYTMINFVPTMFDCMQVDMRPITVFEAEDIVKHLELI